MTTEEILQLAKTFGITPNKYKVCILWKEELLKFARAIRKQTIDEILTTLEEVPNPEANRTAINRIRGI